jgi:hypothetical protein
MKTVSYLPSCSLLKQRAKMKAKKKDTDLFDRLKDRWKINKMQDLPSFTSPKRTGKYSSKACRRSADVDPPAGIKFRELTIPPFFLAHSY